MARPPIRTTTLIIDDINRILAIFGTVMNAHRRLGLESLVTYPHFYRAMHFCPIVPRHKQEIEEAWQRWQDLFLRPGVPPSDDLTVTTENRDAWPEWHNAWEESPSR